MKVIKYESNYDLKYSATGECFTDLAVPNTLKQDNGGSRIIARMRHCIYTHSKTSRQYTRSLCKAVKLFSQGLKNRCSHHTQQIMADWSTDGLLNMKL